ncbi:hypothetical protein ACTHAM_001942 [Cellulomonas soli]|uniref:hypothetical protein n=1 Tax=Cellulomonas soli TaxID=931535 RepID=UPI003F847D91
MSTSDAPRPEPIGATGPKAPPVAAEPDTSTPPVPPVPPVPPASEKPASEKPTVEQPADTTPAEEKPAEKVAPTPPRTPAAATARTSEPSSELFPAAGAPFTTSFGTHALGAVLGLLLAPIGMAVVLLGQSRILVAQADGWDATTELAGIVLVTIGLVLLGAVLLLALWTPALPIAGGAALTVAGGVFLFTPWLARERTLVVLPSEHWYVTITQVVVAGTSGTLLVAGFLLLLGGLVAVMARRQGVHLGVFRERHHPGRATLPPPKGAPQRPEPVPPTP